MSSLSALPALQVKTPLERQQQVMTLKDMMQRQQLGAQQGQINQQVMQENQMKLEKQQRDMAEDRLVMDTLRQGVTLGEAAKRLRDQVSPERISALEERHLKTVAYTDALDGHKKAQLSKQLEETALAGTRILDMPDDLFVQQAPEVLRRLGINPQAVRPEQMRQVLESALVSTGAFKTYLDQGETRAKTRKANAEAWAKENPTVTPVPGRDVPYPPDVEAQRIRMRPPANPKPIPAKSNEDKINAFADAVAMGQMGYQNVPLSVRDDVVLKNFRDGVAAVPPKVRDTIEAMDKAEGIIDTIEANFKELKASRDWTQLAKGSWREIMAKMQADPDAQIALTQIGLLGNLARSVSGERGVLTDGDVQRAMSLLPKITDRADVAERKIAGLRAFAKNGRQAALRHASSKYTRQGERIEPEGGQQGGGGKKDPMGIR